MSRIDWSQVQRGRFKNATVRPNTQPFNLRVRLTPTEMDRLRDLAALEQTTMGEIAAKLLLSYLND